VSESFGGFSFSFFTGYAGFYSDRSLMDLSPQLPVYSTVNSHLTLQESEFESYEIYYAPITLGIHLKELNVRRVSPRLTTHFVTHSGFHGIYTHRPH
jgi:hypothetical protein